MKKSQNDIYSLIREYERKLSETSVPLWMDAPDFLDILDYYEEKNMYFEAELCMRLALKLHPDDTEVLVRRAYRLKNEGRWDEAIAFVNAIPDQDGIDVQFFKAEVALSELRTDDAERHFNNCLRAEAAIAEAEMDAMEPLSNVSPLLLDIGELCMDYGCIALAQKYLARIPETDESEYPNAALSLAECAYQSGHTENALKQLDTLLDTNAYNLDAWVMKADLCNELKRWDACREAADYALAIEPENEKALRFKVCAAIGTTDYDTVLDIYKIYGKLYPNDYTMALSVGEILLNRHQYDDALAVLLRSNRNCPNENPDKIRILSDIAVCYSAHHEMQKAFDTLLSTRSLGVSFADVVFHAATQAFDNHDIEYGEKLLLYAIAQDGLSPEQRLNISRMLCEHNLFGSVSELWHNLLHDHQAHPVPAAPYLAYAARRLLRIRDYKFWLACAIYTDPTLTNAIFRDIYPNHLPQEYLSCAQREFPEG